MKKIYFYLILVILFSLSIGIAGDFPSSTRYEYFLDIGASEHQAATSQYLGMTFTVGVNGTNVAHNLDGFALKLSPDTTEGNLAIHLYSTNASGCENDFTLGCPLVSLVENNTLNGTTICNGVYTAQSWCNISMPTYALQPDTTYAIVYIPTQDWKTKWHRVTTTNGTGYKGGAEVLTTAGVWGRTADNGDLGFEIYGTPVTGESSSITVTLLEPEDDYGISDIGTNFTANYTLVNANLTNATYYLWNSTGIFNKTTVTGDATNSTSLYIDAFGIGILEWNVWACADNSTSYLCDMATSNFSLDVGAKVDAEHYDVVVYETSTETYQINITILTGSTLYSSNLVYNGTSYPVSDIEISEDSYSLTRSIDLPVNTNSYANTSRNFWWSFVYAGDGRTQQNTSIRQQNVSFIVLEMCNGTYPVTTVNFTMKDELAGTIVNYSTNTTTFKSTFNYYLGSGSTYKNHSFQSIGNDTTASYKFCLYPQDKIIKTNTDIEYEAAEYYPRTYYFRNASMTNVTNEIDLNLIAEDDSLKFFVTLKQGTDRFPDGIVTISKYITGEGLYRTISIRESDELGEFIEYFDVDQDYKFSVTRNGVSYGTVDKTVTCEAAPCELTLQLEEAVTDLWQGYYDVFATNIAYTLIYDDTTKLVTYTFNDLTGLAQYFRLETNEVKLNETGANICDDTLYSTAGTLTCNLTGYTGDFTATAYISRSPELIVDYISIIISTIKDTLGATGILVSLFLIVTIALVGAWNPAVGVALVTFSIFMMKVLGFVAFSYTTVILIFVMAIILIVRMKT